MESILHENAHVSSSSFSSTRSAATCSRRFSSTRSLVNPSIAPLISSAFYLTHFDTQDTQFPFPIPVRNSITCFKFIPFRRVDAAIRRLVSGYTLTNFLHRSSTFVFFHLQVRKFNTAPHLTHSHFSVLPDFGHFC